jgi:hypothetical protein
MAVWFRAASEAQSQRCVMLKRRALCSIALLALVDIGSAEATVLHCHGYQVADKHTDQIITLDVDKKVVISIQFSGKGPKVVINTPMNVSSEELQWSYESLGFKYVLSRKNSKLQLLSITNNLLGIFECQSS